MFLKFLQSCIAYHIWILYPLHIKNSNPLQSWCSPRFTVWLVADPCQVGHRMVWVFIKCRKIVEVTLWTPDIKSGPTRCQKGLWPQLMCCVPFRLLSQDFRTGRQSTGDWRIGVGDWSCSQSRTLENENWEEDLFNIQTEVSTWQVWGIYTK